jgi:protein-S-isoprenylcysteine O-methyltransferase Ste14
MTVPRTPEQQKKIDLQMRIAFLLVLIALAFLGVFALAAASVIDRLWMSPASILAALLMTTAIVLIIVVIRTAGKTLRQ